MSRTSILAIGIAAILMICALSGAVVIANNGSNNNGTTDVSTDSDVRGVTSNITNNAISLKDFQFLTVYEEEKVMPILPDNVTDLGDVLADVSDDIVLSDFLDGRAFKVNDTVYTIDSDTAALSYLYSLGYVSIGNKLVLDTFGFNATEEKAEAAAVEIAQVNEEAAEFCENEYKDNDTLDAVMKDEVLLERLASKKVGVQLQQKLTFTNVMAECSNKFLDFADLTVADFRDANILIEPSFEVAILAAEDNVAVDKFAAEKVHFKTFCVSEKESIYTNFMMDTLRDFIYETVVDEEDFYEGSILDVLRGSVFAIDGVPMAVEDSQTLAVYLFNNFGLQIVGNSIIAIDFVPYFVTTRSDADIERMMGDEVLCDVNECFEVNKVFFTADCVENCYKNYTYTFHDVETITPFIFTNIVFDKDCAMTVIDSEMMGNSYASYVLSSFIMFGNTSTDDVYRFFGIISEEVDKAEAECVNMEVPDEVLADLRLELCEEVAVDCIKKVHDDMSDLPTVLDVFMDTPFLFDGELMIVSDIDTLGLYLSQQYLVISNDNEFVFASFDYDGDFDGMRSMTLEDMPAMMFEKFLSNDYFNTCGYSDANVYDGGYFCSGVRLGLFEENYQMFATGAIDQALYNNI